MDPLNDRLASSFIEHDIGIQRLEADQRNKILRELKALEQQLIVKVQKVAGVETFTAARQRALLAQVQRSIAQSYNTILKTQREDMKQLALYETRSIPALVNGQAGANVMAVGAPAQVIKALTQDDTIIGAPLKTIWEQEAGTLRQAFIAQMRQGIMAGETTDDLVRRIRGTAARGYKDGLMHPRERNVEMRVRTSAQSVLNDARFKMYEANADVMEGVQWQSTLDDRTSDICMALSGQAWDLAGNPIGETDQQFPGPPPAHPNCRSTLIPLVKGIGDLLAQPGLDEDIKAEVAKLPQATQSSMDGQVAGDLTYEDWLETKPEAFQKEVLGEGKFALWDADKIGLKDLIDQRNNPLTLAELEAKYGKPTTEPSDGTPPSPPTEPSPTEPSPELTPGVLAAEQEAAAPARAARQITVPTPLPGPAVPTIPHVDFGHAGATEFLKAYDLPNSHAAYLAPLKKSDLVDAHGFVKGYIYLNEAANVGYKLDDAMDFGALFNNGGPSGAGRAAINDAIQRGALTLDAFDGRLPKIYSQHGFEVVARMKFNPEFAPPGWNFGRDDNPDVVFMAYKGGTRANIGERVGQFPAYDAAAKVPYFDDYDSAKSYARGAALAPQPGRGVGGAEGVAAVGQPAVAGGVGAKPVATIFKTINFGDILLEKSFDDFTPAELMAIRRQYPNANDAELRGIWERLWQHRGLAPKATVESLVAEVAPKPKAARKPRKPKAPAKPDLEPTGSVLDSSPKALALQRGTVKKQAHLSESGTSESYKVTFEDGSFGVWKPASGEAEDLREEVATGTFYKREATGWELAVLSGNGDLVPPTVIRQLGNQGYGSVQDFVANSKPAGDLGGQVGRDPDRVKRAAIFDGLIGNTDRHSMNWMITEKGKGVMMLIDHGLILPTAARTARIEYLDEIKGYRDPIPESYKRLWRSETTWLQMQEAMRRNGIEEEAIELMGERRRTLLSRDTITWENLTDLDEL